MSEQMNNSMDSGMNATKQAGKAGMKAGKMAGKAAKRAAEDAAEAAAAPEVFLIKVLIIVGIIMFFIILCIVFGTTGPGMTETEYLTAINEEEQQVPETEEKQEDSIFKKSKAVEKTAELIEIIHNAKYEDRFEAINEMRRLAEKEGCDPDLTELNMVDETQDLFNYGGFGANSSAAEAIASTAERLAYPAGTSSSKWNGGGKIRGKAVKSWNALPVKPTPAFMTAMDKWFPNHWKTKSSKTSKGYSYGARYGACCCHSTKVIVSEAMGRKMPNSLAHPEKYKKYGFTVRFVKGASNINSTLKRGDIVTAKTNGDHHTMIYLGGGKIAEGGLSNCNYSRITKGNIGTRYPKGCYIISAGADLIVKSSNSGSNTSSTMSGVSSGMSIQQEAAALAWPVGTAKSKYSFKTGKRTSAYTKALFNAYPSYKKDQKTRYKTGASCCVFVGVVVRNSGYDPSFPTSNSKQLQRMKNTPSKWKEVSYKDTKAGDIICLGTHHTLIYGGKQGGKHLWYQANLGKTAAKAEYPYAFLNSNDPTSISYKSKHSDLKVFRAIGASGSSGSAGSGGKSSRPTYSSYKVIGTINKSDCTVAAKITGKNGYNCPQSMAYMGDNTYAICFSCTNKGGSAGYIKKYKGSSCKSSSGFLSLGHGNGLCYNKSSDTLYSVRGGSTKAVKIKGSSLKTAGSVSLPVGTSGIAYDNSKQSYYLSSGNHVQITNSSFSKGKRFTKKGTWKYSQDIGGGLGTVCVCTSVNKNSDNRIGLYSGSTGEYYGTYKMGWSGIEIESCDVDEEGHLLILINNRGTNTDYIYKTKEAYAAGEGGGPGSMMVTRGDFDVLAAYSVSVGNAEMIKLKEDKSKKVEKSIFFDLGSFIDFGGHDVPLYWFGEKKGLPNYNKDLTRKLKDNIFKHRPSFYMVTYEKNADGSYVYGTDKDENGKTIKYLKATLKERDVTDEVDGEKSIAESAFGVIPDDEYQFSGSTNKIAIKGIGEESYQLLASDMMLADGSGEIVAYGGGSVANPLGRQKYTITSWFGNRPYPGAGGSTNHGGMDLALPTGSKIYAAESGIVTLSGWNGGYGNCIMIKHAGGMETLYGHQSRLVARKGQQVVRGQLIGYVGSTGNSTGPHLHFEVRINGKRVDPAPYLGYAAGKSNF